MYDEAIKSLSKELNVSEGCANDVFYLRSRSRWTQELEDQLIELHRKGTPPDIYEFGVTRATHKSIDRALLKGRVYSDAFGPSPREFSVAQLVKIIIGVWNAGLRSGEKAPNQFLVDTLVSATRGVMRGEDRAYVDAVIKELILRSGDENG